MKKIPSILFVAMFLMVIACDDEKLSLKEKSKGAPVIALLSPEPADSYSGDVLISATATGKHKIALMQIYFDNALIASESDDAISTTVNTTEFADGEHTVKIVAKDKKGVTSTLERNVTISNSFITLNFVLNNPSPGFRYFFYLLNDEGEQVSDLIEVSASMTEVTFSTPAGHTAAKKYSLAYVEHQPAPDEFNVPVTSLEVTGGYSAGTYNETIGWPPFVDTSIGSHTLTFSGLPSPVFATLHTEVTGGFDVQAYGSVNIGLEKNNANGYIAYQPDPNGIPVYKMLSGLNVGESTTLTPADFTPMNGTFIPAAEGSFYTFSYVWGHKIAGDIQNQRVIWINNPFGGGDVTFGQEMFYPGNNFQEYLSGMIEGFSDHADEYVSFGPTTPTEFKRLGARITSVTQTENSVSVTGTGSYEFLQLSGGAQTPGGASVNYRLILPDGDGTYSLPEVPQELADMFEFPPSSEWNMSSTYIGDYSGLEGYNDYFDAAYKNAPAIYNANSWRSHSLEFVSRTAGLSSAVARMKGSQNLLKNYFSKEKFQPGPYLLR